MGDYAEQFLKSPSWAVPIAEYIDDNSVIFDDEEEHTFAQTECHQNFCNLIDSLLCAHLLQVDVSPDDFAQYAGQQLDGNSNAKRVLVDELSSVSDFLVFKNMMVSRNKGLDKQATEAIEIQPVVDKENVGNAPVSVAPIAGATNKPGGYGRDAVLQMRKKERDEQLRKWLEDPADKKAGASTGPPLRKMTASELRDVMKTGTEARGEKPSFLNSLQKALA